MYIPDNAICFFKDGDKWCCVFGDFIDLQQSPAGFGSTFDTAIADLKSNLKNHLNKQLVTIKTS